MNKTLLYFVLCFTGIQMQAQQQQDYFITTWKITHYRDTSITIPTTGSGYNYDVDWNNDGIFDEIGVTGDITHDYGLMGTYTVAIRGSFPRIYFNNYNDRHKIISINQWGTNAWSSMSSAFYGCENLTSNATDAPNLSIVTDMSGMFEGASSFNQDIGNWNVSNVTDMSNMFSHAFVFNQNIGNWNVSNVTDMSYMFSFTSYNQDIGNWDVSNVTDMSLMFYDASVFNKDISHWNVGNVTNMYGLFKGASSFNQDISNWNVSNVENMSSVFNRASSFNQDISNWNVSNVVNMSDMFSDASVFNQDIGNWNVSNVTSMFAMFKGALAFNQNLGNWNVGNVGNMSFMFSFASYNQDISNWNVSNVTNMQEMFEGASSFNQDIGDWNVSNVMDMRGMFNGVSSFNQDIGDWNVSNVIHMQKMFGGASSFNQDIGNWNVISVYNMDDMFSDASSFNQDISKWDVSQVLFMDEMFRDASSFNQDISKWNVSNVLFMYEMFRDASSFNQDISKWNVSNVVEMKGMFNGVTLSTDNYDALLIGWNKLKLKSGVKFDGGNSTYCLGQASRENMITTYGWNITDGGQSISTPLAICQDIIVYLDASGNVSITENDVDNGSNFGCLGSGTLSVSPSSFTCSDIGVNTVTFKATDVNGNESTCTPTVTVVDNMAPQITCPSNQTITANQYLLPDYFENGLATVSDNCTNPVTIIGQNPSAGTLLNSGTHIIRFTAEDSSGNSNTCQFELIVDDTLKVPSNEKGISDLTIYPNPTKDTFTIVNESNLPLKSMIIYDITGRLIKTMNLENETSHKTIDISNLTAATYFIKINSYQGSITKKLNKL